MIVLVLVTEEVVVVLGHFDHVWSGLLPLFLRHSASLTLLGAQDDQIGRHDEAREGAVVVEPLLTDSTVESFKLLAFPGSKSLTEQCSLSALVPRGSHRLVVWQGTSEGPRTAGH